MDADTDTSHESPEAETWAYLEQLEQRAQLRKIRRTAIPCHDEAQREGEDFL